ncbi:MAG: hypothetical protein ACOCXM_06025 [Myxococcota bacterium]
MFRYGLLWGLAMLGCSSECAEPEASSGGTVEAAPAPGAGKAEPPHARQAEETPAPEREGGEESSHPPKTTPKPPPRSPVGPTPNRRPPSRPTSDPQAACRDSGGRWRQFRNTCVDSCRLVRAVEPVACGMALTMGCDCGPDRCWDGSRCVGSPALEPR